MSATDQVAITINYRLDNKAFAEMRSQLDDLDVNDRLASDMEDEIGYLLDFGTAVDDSSNASLARDLRPILAEDIDRVERAINDHDPLIEIVSLSDPDYLSYSVTADYNNELLRSFARMTAAFIV